MDPLQDGDLSSLHSQQIEKENVKSEYPSQLGLLRAQRKGIQIRRKNETCQFPRIPLPLLFLYPLIIILQVISSQVIF